MLEIIIRSNLIVPPISDHGHKRQLRIVLQPFA